MDTSFQNKIIDAIVSRVDKAKKHPGNKVVKVIYGGTPSGSPARRLLIDMWAYRAKGKWGLDKCVVEFVVDVAKQW
jgi:hypothetical protein